MQVSVRELKNHLSKYLKKAYLGAQIIIVSHHKPVARLIPLPQSDNPELQRLLQMEGVSWNRKTPRGGKLLPKIKGKTASDYLLEDRD